MAEQTGEALGVGVIGTGFMGKAHAMALTNAPLIHPLSRPAHLHTICDLDRPAADRAARRFGFAQVATDWRRLLDDPGIEVITITTPTFCHYDMAKAALAAGKHVLCEKPLTVTAAAAAELAADARAAGRVAMVGYNYLTNPTIIEARRLIESGALGRLHTVRLVNDEDYMADPMAGYSWRCRRDLSGAGTLGDLGAHALSLGLYLAGPVAAVAGMTRTVVPRRPTASGTAEPVENEDVAEVLLRFSSGAGGMLGSSRISWGRKNYLALEISGEGGTLVFDQERFNELHVMRAGDSGFTRVLAGPQHAPYGAFLPAPGHQLGFNDLKTVEMVRLLRAVAGEGAAFPDFDFGARIQAIQEAIEDSAAAGSWIDLPGHHQTALAQPPAGEWDALYSGTAHT